VASAVAVAASAIYDGNSANGEVAIFSTKDQMVPGDTDQEEDVYARSWDPSLGEYVTREVSIGPKGGNDALAAHYDGMSSDGTEVFFSTREAMVPGDTDNHREDIYARNLAENRTILVSQGDGSCAAQNCGNGEVDSSFVTGGVAPDGGMVFFGTNERLTSADQDNTFDIYVRDIQAQMTSLVSTRDASCATCTSEGQDPLFRGTDDAGDKAFFTTTERLTEADTDSGKTDIYERVLVAETTSLVSATVPGACPANLPLGQNCEPSYGGVSPNGSHVFFETNEQISGEDVDKSQDVYDWSGAGTAALASIGQAGAGNAESVVTYAGTSTDGGTVYFETSERLDTIADTDSTQDIYQRSGGITALVSAGEVGKGNLPIPASFDWASRTASQMVVFTTAEALTSADTDSSQDVYKRVGGVTTLVSIGPEGIGGIDATFAGASDDGSRIFFVTAESLVPADTDSSNDIYMPSAGGTVLVSAGQVGGNGNFAAGLHGVSSDGSAAYFATPERLTVDDVDKTPETDVYRWSGSGTLLVSVGNSPDLVPPTDPPTLEGTSPSSPNASTTPAIFGQAPSGALVKIYSTFNCSGEPVAQGNTAALAAPGLTVTVPVAKGSTTNYRATAEVQGNVSGCSTPLSYRQEDPPPPPPPAEGGGGGGGGSTGGSTGGTGGPSGGAARNGVTYVTPLTRITYGPAAKTRLRRPTFRFVDSTEQPGTRFFCRVDRQRWNGCNSPIKLKKLSLGRHVFSVKAVNAVGAPGPVPVKRAFKVVGG
jgi:hypothetical protein